MVFPYPKGFDSNTRDFSYCSSIFLYGSIKVLNIIDVNLSHWLLDPTLDRTR
jgi:hypothetical protein